MFQPGQSGNPSGRRRADFTLAAYVREKTRDGRDLVDFLLSIVANGRAASKVRVQAAEILMDRGFGRPVQQTELSGHEGGPVVIALEWSPAQADDAG